MGVHHRLSTFVSFFFVSNVSFLTSPFLRIQLLPFGNIATARLEWLCAAWWSLVQIPGHQDLYQRFHSLFCLEYSLLIMFNYQVLVIMVTLLVAMATTTSFDKYDNGYGIYDDGYDSPGDKYQDPLHVEPIKAIPVNAIVYKRISGPQYPIRANSIHYYHMYPIYPIYPYYY